MGTTVNKGWKVTCAVFVILNVVTLRLLLDARKEFSGPFESLAAYKFSEAIRDATADFAAGRLRIYELATSDAPRAGEPLRELQPVFTGRKDGPIEIWTRPRFREDRQEEFMLRLASEYVTTYNARMRILYQRQIVPKPVGTNTTGYPIRRGRLAPETAPDQQER
jgi:hypothetical protein